MRLLSSCCLAGEERLSVKWPFGLSSGERNYNFTWKIQSHGAYSVLDGNMFFYEPVFWENFFRGSSPPLENAWETNGKGKLRVRAVFAQCLQLCNINTCHHVFYSLVFWCLKKIGKQLFLRGNSCQLRYSAKKQAAWPNWKIHIWESQTSPRPICDFTTWRKREIRFTKNSGRRANGRVCVGSSPWQGRIESLFVWVSELLCLLLDRLHAIHNLQIFHVFEAVLCELERGPSSGSIHRARIASYITRYINKRRTLMKHRLQLQLRRGNKEGSLLEIS